MDLGRWFRSLLVTVALALCPVLPAAETFTVATYNVENYLDTDAGTRKAKSATARAMIRESIRALKPAVLALQEMGGANALLELRASLKSEGLDYPHWEHVTGFDTNLHLAVLSQHPFSTRRAHTNASYLLQGRRFRVSPVEADVHDRAGKARLGLGAALLAHPALAGIGEEGVHFAEPHLLLVVCRHHEPGKREQPREGECATCHNQAVLCHLRPGPARNRDAQAAESAKAPKRRLRDCTGRSSVIKPPHRRRAPNRKEFNHITNGIH